MTHSDGKWSTSGHEMDVILINIEDLVGETVKVLLDM